MSKTRNVVFAAGLIAGVTACGLFPSYYVKRQKKNLHQADKPLNGSQIMRGMYLNSGSRFVETLSDVRENTHIHINSKTETLDLTQIGILKQMHINQMQRKQKRKKETSEDKKT